MCIPLGINLILYTSNVVLININFKYNICFIYLSFNCFTYLKVHSYCMWSKINSMIWLSVVISRSNVVFRPVQWRRNWPTSSHPGAYYPDPHHPPCWLVVVVVGGQSVRRVSQHIWHGSLGARDMYMRNYSVDCPFGVASSKDGCAWVVRCCFHARLPVSHFIRFSFAGYVIAPFSAGE